MRYQSFAQNSRWKHSNTAPAAHDPTDPAGSNQQIQFNANGVFGGSSKFTWDGTANKLSVDGDISVTGNISARRDVVTAATSDISLKENISKISNPLQMIKGLNGFIFDWNDKYSLYDSFKGARQVGVAAQDVEEVMPELVTERKNGQKTVTYDQLIPLLIEGGEGASVANRLSGIQI